METPYSQLLGVSQKTKVNLKMVFAITLLLLSRRRGLLAKVGALPSRMLPVLVLGVALSLAGCGAKDDAMVGYPEPGTMKVLSAAPLPAQSQNLAVNPYMRQWWVGSPVPEGYTAPKPEFSSLEPLVSGEVGALRQAWKALDDTSGVDDLFHFIVPRVSKGGVYEIGTIAEGSEGAQASIALWQETEPGKYTLLQDNFLTIQGDGFGLRWYAKRFSLPQDGPLVVAVHATPSMKQDAWAAWHYWSVTAVRGGTEI